MLTRQQSSLLDYLVSCEDTLAPSFEEMRQALGLKSKSDQPWKNSCPAPSSRSSATRGSGCGHPAGRDGRGERLQPGLQLPLACLHAGLALECLAWWRSGRCFAGARGGAGSAAAAGSTGTASAIRGL